LSGSFAWVVGAAACSYIESLLSGTKSHWGGWMLIGSNVVFKAAFATHDIRCRTDI
jgi:hypothetical protein